MRTSTHLVLAVPLVVTNIDMYWHLTAAVRSLLSTGVLERTVHAAELFLRSCYSLIWSRNSLQVFGSQ